MVKSQMLILSVVVMITACGAHTTKPQVAPQPSAAALAAKPVLWSTREPTARLIPVSTRRVQLIITPGWTKGEHFAWLISDGSDVLAVYKANGSDLSDIVAGVVHSYYPTVANPTDKVSISVMGSFHAPPPPPPDPPGFPGVYVQEVMHAAWTMNRESARFDAPATPSGGP